MKRALLYNFGAALLILVGLVLGIVLGENTEANAWIFASAGGMFIYISLVDIVSIQYANSYHFHEILLANFDGFKNNSFQAIYCYIIINLALNTDFEYLLKPPRNEYPQSMYYSKSKKYYILLTQL